MKLLYTLLAALLLAAAPAAAQTVKALAYNTTNGNVAYSGTNVLTFTNSVTFASINLVGQTNEVEFQTVRSTDIVIDGAISFEGGPEATRTNLGLTWAALTNSNAASFYTATLDAYSLIQAAVAEDPPTLREDIGLPLPALTNTSNVTMMRALAGSTNTAEPFSGTFNVIDNSNTPFAIVVSNGIILSVTEY
jgi:hypothetical protein